MAKEDKCILDALYPFQKIINVLVSVCIYIHIHTPIVEQYL